MIKLTLVTFWDFRKIPESYPKACELKFQPKMFHLDAEFDQTGKKFKV